MYLNNFSVRIVPGVESGGYVELPHNTQYSLTLRNSRPVRCDARVEVDGKHVGTWRIAGHSNITLERPAHDSGRFTFYKVGTSESQAAALNGSDPNLGLVKVAFTPEMAPEPRPVWDASSEVVTSGGMASASCYTATVTRAAGGTGLSGQSGQRFTDALPILHDHSQQTVIHLRLVCNDHDGPRPLTSFSSPVPPPIR